MSVVFATCPYATAMSSERGREELMSALLSQSAHVVGNAVAQAAEHSDGDRLLAEATKHLSGYRPVLQPDFVIM